VVQQTVDAPPTTAFAGPSRRSRRLVAIAVAVVVLVSVIVVVVSRRYHHDGPPNARAAGVAVLDGSTLYLVDGRKIQLDTDQSPAQAEVVPGGFLYNAFADDGSITLRLAEPPSGAGFEDFGDLGDSQYTVSPDGTTAVIILGDAGPQAGNDVVAINLGTGVRLTNRTMTDPSIDGVAGDWVLLTYDIDAGKTYDSPSELWNIRTGAVTHLPGAGEYHYYAVLPNGDVIRSRGFAQPGVVVPAGGTVCYDIVPLGASASPAGSAYCGPTEVSGVWPSPDGTWALVETDSDVVLVRVADLRAGRWAPVHTDPGANPYYGFWDSPTTVVMPDENGHERCSVNGTCRNLHLSAHDIPVPTLGG
jgi:hypothetical protein